MGWAGILEIAVCPNVDLSEEVDCRGMEEFLSKPSSTACAFRGDATGQFLWD